MAEAYAWGYGRHMIITYKTIQGVYSLNDWKDLLQYQELVVLRQDHS
jgi:hypothetical protein